MKWRKSLAMKQTTAKIRILISTIGICLLAFLLLVIYIPKLLGYRTFYIESGSMSPTIKQGSVVLEKPVEFEKIREGDVLTFRNTEETEYFTHRVIGIDETNQMFITKGDANDEQDPSETSYYFAEGKVDFAVPYVGYVMQFLNSTTGRIVIGCVYIAWIAIEIEIFVMKRKAPQED